MKNRIFLGVFPAILALILTMGQPVAAKSQKPTILKPCTQCHEAEESYLRGRLKSKSRKAKTLQINMGSAVWQVVFDDNTELNGAKKITKVPTNKEIGVEIEKRGNTYYAKSIDVKQPADIPASWVIDVKGMEQLVGTDKALLVDARPGKVYLEGHLEGAINSYDAMFDKNVSKLPKNKNDLVVFYCGGPT